MSPRKPDRVHEDRLKQFKEKNMTTTNKRSFTRNPRSFFPYPGSKWRLMKTIIPLLPDHDHLVVPFGGSGTEILAKLPSRLESFNDKDDLVSNVFWVAVHGPSEELRRRIQDTPMHSKRFHEDARLILQQPIIDRLESAWAFLVVAHSSFVARHPGLVSSGDWSYSCGRPFGRWLVMPHVLTWVKRRFSRVQLFSQDWQDVVDRFDGLRTCFLFDPPYHPDCIKFRSHYYRHIMTNEQHEEMLVRLRKIKGTVVLCHYGHELYERLLAGWHSVTVNVPASIAVNGDRPNRSEMIWMNYDRNGRRAA
jgi:DNA adenine methylase